MSTQSTNGGFKADDLLIQLADTDEPIGAITSAGRDRFVFDGNTIDEFLIVPQDDPRQEKAQLVSGVEWTDLRDRPVGQLPAPESEVYDVWQVTRAAAQPFYVDSCYVGMTYRACGGKIDRAPGVNNDMVLTNKVPTECFGLSDIVAQGAAPAPIVPPCPTTTPISGAGTAHSAYYTTRAAAIAAATALVPGRATTDAGLELNGFTCPNPTCTTKTLGPVIPAIKTPVDSSLSIIASFLYLEWRYTAAAEYTWTSSVICS